MVPLLDAVGVSKAYGEVRAIDRLELRLPAVGVAAVLGPNGAGKTTLIRMASTLTRPDEGVLRVCGREVDRTPGEVRRLIGLAGQHAAVVEALTGRENVMMIGRLCGLGRRGARQRAGELVEQLGLAEVADRRVNTYSGGMRRRVDLAVSLVHRPTLLLLDEPTVGLDPSGRHQLWELIRGLAAGETGVVLTTQYLEEADALADYVAVIDGGRCVDAGTPHELKARHGADSLDEVFLALTRRDVVVEAQ